MFKAIINFFNGNDNDLDLDAIDAKLDALERAADERIAVKEACLAQITESVQQKQQEFNQLKEIVKRYENAVNRANN
jgi:endonuclease IV